MTGAAASDAATIAAMLAVVLAGAATQRLTGMGFALVASPLLVLVLGPFQGVLMANLLSLLVNVSVLAMTWRLVEVRRTLLLAVPALCLVPVGVFVAKKLPAPPLQVAIGALVLAALLVPRLAGGRTLPVRGRSGAIAAGAASGFMNATAGVGGPALALYAVGSKWDHARFVASAQLYFTLLNAGSVAAKGMPHLGVAVLLAAVASLALGVGLGQLVARRVPAPLAMRAVVVLAAVGATLTMVKGLLAW